ncbi:MAG TPA: helix-turn-helix transcriptional regulator [Gemmatimonadales bacterium]|nr:helix-turn-helix transcriptional regulator [Gemmatimonadales bacterium]
MNSTRKARLESEGWRIGDAQHFLNLSKEEAAFVEMKLALADCLRASRVRRNLSQARVAELVGSSQSRVAKMESGDPSVSIDLLLRAVLAMGETPRQIIKAFAGRKKLQSAREAARRLAALGGTMPRARAVPRRRAPRRGGEGRR